ncbi:Hypp3291 [Branchiostoma lanceolatum]|uniref:Hypp3291 protein n=1 Tax=Branchiostoma lanceolatum TaxID=7740 RepID=A0A8K0EXA7_BRALA|nr:Hypp3291 [Branchiostoma lanceolatum]
MAAVDKENQPEPTTPEADSSPGSVEGSIYTWQDRRLSRSARKRALEQRREELLDETPEDEEDITAIQDNVVSEWISLLQERDRLLREQVNEDNQRLMDEYMRDLFFILQRMGTLDSSAVPLALKTSLIHVYGEVLTYCHTQDLDMSQMSDCQSSVAPPPSPITLAPPPPPPPTPPPPPAIVVTSPKKTTNQLPAVPNLQPKRRKLGMQAAAPQTPIHSTPLRPSLHGDLQRLIKSDLRRSLRKTDCMRSPGGTPARRRDQPAFNSMGNWMVIGLQKKFRNVQYSPTTPTTPNDSTEESFCLSVD